MASTGAPLAFGWKTTTTRKRRQPPTELVEELAAGVEREEEQAKSALDEWMARQKGGGGLMLEDAEGKSKRIQAEGCTLAEAGKFRQALARWAEAINLTPVRAVLHELRAQCHLELGEIFEAVQAAERAVDLDPAWPDAHQTLGRVQINMGELELAIASFRRAAELDAPPRHSGAVAKEIQESDLPDALELMADRDKLLQQVGTDFAGRLEQPPSFLRRVEGDRVCLQILAPAGVQGLGASAQSDIASDLLPRLPLT
jgi:tetratricopeptide (TPR) repeat protein